MERLTDKTYADLTRVDYQAALAFGVEKDLQLESYLKLAAYEDTNLSPENIQEVVNLFDGLPLGDIPEEIKSWAERCAWHVKQCDKLRAKLDKALYEKAKLEAELSIARQDIADILWLNGECRYCKHAKKIEYSGVEQYRCSLGSGSGCRPEWNGGCKTRLLLRMEANVISEKERQNRERLFTIMQENPDIPIIPFVDGDIVAGDEFGSWMGSWGTTRIDEYLFPENDWEPAIFKSDDDVFDTLEKCLSVEQFDQLPDSEEECRKVYDSLPWTKAIIVNIDMPEV